MIRRGLPMFAKIANRKSILNIGSNKNFSSKGIDNLKKSIEKEIIHEETNYQGVYVEDTKKFLNDNGFSFYDKENTTELELRRTVNNLDVCIIFQSKPPIPVEEKNREVKEGLEEKSPESMSEFIVKITKVGQKSGLLIEAVTFDTQIHINQIHTNDDIPHYYQKYISGKFPNEYKGPDFSTLDDRIQQSFMKYFDEIGINEETGSFIEVMSFDKDQRLYQNWLKNVKNFLV